MVKYADGPTTSVEVEIDAPPATMWSLRSDIDAPADVSEQFQGADRLDPYPTRGVTLPNRNDHQLVGRWSAVCTITATDPERAFEWTVGGVDHQATRRRVGLSPDDAVSASRLTAEIGPAPSGLTPAIERMVERHANMRRTIDGYEQLAGATRTETS